MSILETVEVVRAEHAETVTMDILGFMSEMVSLYMQLAVRYKRQLYPVGVANIVVGDGMIMLL